MSKARDTLDALSLTNAPDDGKQYVRQYDNWEEAPVTGYALLDFGTVAPNNRYVQVNPFGNNTPVICVAEVYYNSIWSQTGFIFNHGANSGYGVQANYVAGEGLVIQTGSSNLIITSSKGGGAHNTSSVNVPSPCRVHVWRVEG